MGPWNAGVAGVGKRNRYSWGVSTRSSCKDASGYLICASTGVVDSSLLPLPLPPYCKYYAHGSAVRVASAALDGATIALSSASASLQAAGASTITNGGTLQGRGGASLRFAGGLASTGSTVDLQQSALTVASLTVTTSTMMADATTVTATELVGRSSTFRIQSRDLRRAG